jgi:hypothetical protein
VILGGAVGPDDPYTISAQEGLANVLLAENRYAEAETLLKQIKFVARMKTASPALQPQ